MPDSEKTCSGFGVEPRGPQTYSDAVTKSMAAWDDLADAEFAILLKGLTTTRPIIRAALLEAARRLQAKGE